jgi:F0F1-type ATP synthase assembly protein I
MAKRMASSVGVLLGLFLGAPLARYLVGISPWLLAVTLVILLVILTFLKVIDREKAEDRAAARPRGMFPRF